MTRARIVAVCFASLLLLTEISAAQSKLKITSIADNATVSTPTIVLRGVGADPKGTLEVTVTTDQPYVQKGRVRINADGTWSFAPVYLSGELPHESHTIEVTIIRNNERGESASVSGIRRRGPTR